MAVHTTNDESGTDVPYGPAINADDTRQAQHMNANDAPVDVNMNAVVARTQAMAFTIATQTAQDRADRRGIIADKDIKS